MSFKFEKLEIWKRSLELTMRDKGFNLFLGIALRSGIEVVGCPYIVKGRKLISEEKFNLLYEELLSMTKMIQSFRKSLKVGKVNGREPKTES